MQLILMAITLLIRFLMRWQPNQPDEIDEETDRWVEQGIELVLKKRAEIKAKPAPDPRP